MKRKTCLKDIAEKVGVSTALVSYVLNNKKEGRIKKSVAERIKEVAAELNYRTNQIAKSLKTNKTFTIGLVVADISNPFSSSLARIIEDEADKNNYTVLFGSYDESVQRSDKLIDTFLDRQVDGLIIAPGENSASQIALLQQQHIPFVLVDRYFPEINTNYVAMDNFKASYIAVQHLISCGCQRIGMITLKTSLFNMTERKRGYMETLEKNGIAFDESRLIELVSANMKEHIESAINDLLSQDVSVDALLFGTNVIAMHALKYINTLRVKVPEQLALVSFDRNDAWDLFYAPLTHINQPLRQMAQLATKILLEAIGGNTQITQLSLSAELVIRSSTMVPLASLSKGTYITPKYKKGIIS